MMTASSPQDQFEMTWCLVLFIVYNGVYNDDDDGGGGCDGDDEESSFGDDLVGVS